MLGILDALQTHFTPTTNVLYPRHCFFDARQTTLESVDQFYVRIRALATPCQFGAAAEDDMIRDRLVLGSRDRDARNSLFKASDIAIDKVLHSLRISESAASQLKSIDASVASPDPPDALQFVHSRSSRGAPRRGPGRAPNRSAPPRPPPQSPPGPQAASSRLTPSSGNQFVTCHFCGSRHARNRERFPAWGKTCSFCGIPNHFPSVCRQRARSQSVRLVDEEPDPAAEYWEDSELFMVAEDLDDVTHLTASAGTASPKLKLMTVLNVHIRHRAVYPLRCQLDTGATCNILSLDTLCAITGDADPPLHVSHRRLRLINDCTILPLGEYWMDVSVGTVKTRLNFVIVEAGRIPLLSATACLELGLIALDDTSVMEVNHVTAAPNPTVRSSSALLGPSPTSAAAVLNHFPDVFRGLGSLPGSYHIDVDPGCRPVQQAPRRVPVALLEPLQAKLYDLGSQGIIARLTTPTEWISSLVLVHKRDILRICIDPRDLNLAIRRPKYPMPTLDDVLPKLAGAKIFSVLDAKDGFHQVRLTEESALLTAFWTPFGRYFYKRLPFGISSAPEEFQRRLLEGLDGLQGVVDIADDILVTGRGDTDEAALLDHNRNLAALLERARALHLKLNRSKVRLALMEVAYMGHLISADGIKPDPAKVAAITEMAPPHDKKSLQVFLGCVTYLSRFLPDLSRESEPLRALLHKDAAFAWMASQQSAFVRLKQLLSEAPVLAYYDVHKEVTIQCDASDAGLGAVLLQDLRPVAYASRSLTQTERAYAQIEKECLSILFGCVRFDHFIGGRSSVTVHTDHQPLVSIFRKPLRSTPKRLQRMLLQLQPYTLDAQWIAGSKMHIADMLSRAALPHQGPPQVPPLAVYHLEDVAFADIAHVSQARYLAVSSATLADVRRATAADPDLQRLRTIVHQGWPSLRTDLPQQLRALWSMKEDFTEEDGVLFKGARILVPQSLRADIMRRLHYCHLGADATVRKAKELVYWAGLEEDIRSFVATCEPCNAFHIRQCREPLMSFDIPTYPWQMVGQDVFTLRNRDYLVTIDFYSGYYELDHLTNTDSATIIKHSKAHFARFGAPQIMVTDNAPNLVSKEFAAFARDWGFTHITTSPYYSQANGKAESAVKIAKRLVKKAIYAKQDIQLALLAWRNTPQVDGTSPNQKLFARRTRDLVPLQGSLLLPAVVPGVPESIARRQDTSRRHYDKGAQALPEIPMGSVVKVDPGRRHAPWIDGVCTALVGPRSYLVETASGTKLRRNRRFIRVIRPPQSQPRVTSTAGAKQAPIPHGDTTTSPQAATHLATVPKSKHRVSTETHTPGPSTPARVSEQVVSAGSPRLTEEKSATPPPSRIPVLVRSDAEPHHLDVRIRIQDPSGQAVPSRSPPRVGSPLVLPQPAPPSVESSTVQPPRHHNLRPRKNRSSTVHQCCAPPR